MCCDRPHQGASPVAVSKCAFPVQGQAFGVLGRRRIQLTPLGGGNRLPAMIDLLKTADPEVYELCRAEERRQEDKIRLIPSENYVSKAVLEASSSVFTNKYSEGYVGKRYYEGQQYVDPLEQLAIDRAKSLFGAAHAN